MKGISTLLLAIISDSAFAHPHAKVDQQASLTLWEDNITIRYAITPSYREGSAIFAALDSDSNGHLSDFEMRNFANTILVKSVLKVNGDTRNLSLVDVNSPEREKVEKGHGAFIINAKVQNDFDSTTLIDLHFSVGYKAFSPTWFIQPWFKPGALAYGSAPIIKRTEDSSEMIITISE